MEKIFFTDELHNHLIHVAAMREKNSPKKLSKRQALEMQAELFCGAVTAIDYLNGEYSKEKGETCATPLVLFSIMRGDLLKKIEPKSETA